MKGLIAPGLVFAIISLYSASAQQVKTPLAAIPSDYPSEGKLKINGNDSGIGDLHFVLQPHEKREAIEITESCVTLESDIPMEITYGLGRAIYAALPTGARYIVPAGKYPVQNINNLVLKYKLTDAAECKKD